MIGELLPGAAHPALYALLGALVIGFLQGRARMALMIAVPLLGLWNLFLLPADFVQEVEFLGLPQQTPSEELFRILIEAAKNSRVGVDDAAAS